MPSTRRDWIEATVFGILFSFIIIFLCFLLGSYAGTIQVEKAQEAKVDALKTELETLNKNLDAYKNDVRRLTEAMEKIAAHMGKALKELEEEKK